MATEFMHNGITIQLLSSGKFATIKGGVEIRADSLSGIKKKLDAKNGFVPFSCLYKSWQGSDYKPTQVIGIGKSRKQGREYFWKLANGVEIGVVVLDTLENRALLKKQTAMRERHEATRAKMAAEWQELAKKIERKQPEGA